MARRWRIRYKLLLGFGLFVGIMALLLLGTLRGLWSYYQTMNSIRSKLAEEKAAAKFKEAVADVLRLADDPSPAAPRREAPQPAPPPVPGLPTPDAEGRAPPETLHDALAAANHRLDDYEVHLQDTISHGRDLLGGEQASDLIAALRGNFKDLEEAAGKGGASIGPHTSDSKMRDKDRQRLEQPLKAIKINTEDLCTLISDEVDRHINGSRSHYQITLWISIPTGVVGFLLVCGMMRSLYGWVFHPIRDLGEGVARVARGDFSRRIELASGDEMEDLAAAFNDMMQRLNDIYNDLARQVNERSRQLVRSERLASVGFLAAGVAHEINNPLASIAFCSEALEARLSDLLRAPRAAGRANDDGEVFTKYLKMIQEEAFRCKKITESLLAFSRTTERRREPTDLRELVQSVLDVTQHLQPHRGKHITFEVQAERVPGGQIFAWVNSEEIKSVVLNLVTNALESMEDNGHLVIRLKQQGDRAELQFSDNGCGMTHEVLENIFEPFFTRSRSGKGTGLGLTITHRIIHQHGGEIEAASPGAGQGSTFTVRLPTQPAPEEKADADNPDVRSLSEARRKTRAA